MAKHIRLDPGVYIARRTLQLVLMHNSTEKEERVVGTGGTFTVPRLVNGHWQAVKYFPEFGEGPPRFERIDDDRAEGPGPG